MEHAVGQEDGDEEAERSSDLMPRAVKGCVRVGLWLEEGQQQEHDLGMMIGREAKFSSLCHRQKKLHACTIQSRVCKSL